MQSLDYKLKTSNTNYVTARHDVQYFPSSLTLSLEGVSQMDSILPERLPALVRPAFDLVLRRIRTLKRCAQACGCKIMPRDMLAIWLQVAFQASQPLQG